MPISISVEEDTGYLRFTYTGHVDAEDLAMLMDRLASGDYPKDEFVINDLTGAISLDVDPTKIAQLTMKRRSIIPSSTAQPVCSAIVGLTSGTEMDAKMWMAFYEGDPKLHFKHFETEDEAQVWLSACKANRC